MGLYFKLFYDYLLSRFDAVEHSKCHNERMANVKKYVDPGWPTSVPGGGHAVTEVSSKLVGASSPFGDDLELPIPPEKVLYVNPYTRINR